MRPEKIVKIYCGLYRSHDDDIIPTHDLSCALNDSSNKFEFFWPVLQAVKCPNVAMDSSVFHLPYKLIFSSKTAIDFFYNESAKKHESILDFCTGIYCVGDESKHYAQNIFGDTGHRFFVPNTDGMKNLICEFALTKSYDPLLFIVAKTGRSITAITECNFSSTSYILPIYDVIPYESHFLETYMSNILANQKIQVVFECRSGQILDQVSKFLMQYFACNDIISLPKNIFFSCFGQSTLDKVKELYGQRTG